MKHSKHFVKISRILHAGYLFEYKNTHIVFDPIFENPFSINCFAFPELQFEEEEIRKQKFNGVFISHYHDDHCSIKSLSLLNKNTPIYIFCIHSELFELIREAGFTKIYSLKLNESIHIGPFEIITRKALDEDIDSIFQIKVAQLNILNVVDSWIDFETMNLLESERPWDLILWPFQTMREIEVISPSRASPATREIPYEWIEQLKILNPRILVASSCQFRLESWSWYNKSFFPISYQSFKEQMKALISNTIVINLTPSTSFTIDNKSIQTSSPISWITPIGDQSVDYEYDPYLTPPPTSEIAKHFESLHPEQIERVHYYCKYEIVNKYNFFNFQGDGYFSKLREWKLSLYDCTGTVKHFYYQINDSKILEVSEIQQGPISWLTEIPITKLYNALELGETLTSMYMRINDEKFDKDVEKEIILTDVFEDPLINCLFNNKLFAYQKNQIAQLAFK